MNVLIFGSSSFAAKTLVPQLTSAGHEVYTFNRGPEGAEGNSIRGRIGSLLGNSHWPVCVDVVLNYTLLKDQTIEENVEFCRELIQLCKQLHCPTLIHIASVSAFKFDSSTVNQDSVVEPVAEKKGPYGALKVATENYLRANSDGINVVFVKPGFILGEGLVSATVGTAVKLPGGRLLILGNAADTFPITTRQILNDVIVKLLEKDYLAHGDNYLIADKNSPTKLDYIRYCSEQLGQSKGVWTLPVPLWLGIAGAGQGVLILIGKGKTKVWNKIRSVSRVYRYDSAPTEQKLGMSLACDWRKALSTSFDRQELNFELPTLPRTGKLDGVSRILMLGFGRIVLQKHLKGLEGAGFTGKIDVFDPFLPQVPECGFQAGKVDDPLGSDASVVVVSTPGRLHYQAISQLPASTKLVLIEKPVVYAPEELAAWQALEAERGIKVAAFHNYRLKQNVLSLMAFMKKHNPGEIVRSVVLFDSPPVANENAVWARNERVARTLLFDYGLHFLDIGCMFGQDYQGVDVIDWSKNSRGETSDIAGVIKFANYSTMFQLRQAHGVSRTSIELIFTNYIARLTFFPDTLTIVTGRDSFIDRANEFNQQTRAILSKVTDKLGNRESDLSHQLVYQDAVTALQSGEEPVTSLRRVAQTYRILDDIQRTVYGE